ncbi:calcium-binding protein [Rhizobium alvei]|uniref:Calcium-binding protein n=1 Tax=Rhizobium alvei TaxID=1132659 RepID=A0ABT8YJS7_9HYPH|nr:hypothetical protein [Rhizobium alvei]MDO6963593.1 hypothetical protein [Rhizobium alvei]
MAKIAIKAAMGSYGLIQTAINFDSLGLEKGETTSQAVLSDAFGGSITFKGTGFSFNKSGDATAGTATTIEFRNYDGDLVLSVTNGSFAMKSIFGADVGTLLGKLQAGKDLIVGTDLEDILVYGANPGNDTIRAMGGDDYIIGSAGNNIIDGGDGIDTLKFEEALLDGGTMGIIVDNVKGTVRNAWGGTDTITSIETFFGTTMKDVFKGGAGAEEFDGSGGADKITGGKGADTFDFFAYSGKDTITDFGVGKDIIHLVYGQMETQIDSFDDLSIAYRNGNAIITLDADTVLTLNGVSKSELSAADFDFGFF